MKNYFERKEEMRREQEKFFAMKTNLRLKYAAYTSIGISFTLILLMTFLMDSLSDTTLLLMRGFTGLFAIIFMIIIAILLYRVNSSHLNEKHKIRNHR